MVIHSIIAAVSNSSVLEGNAFPLRLCCVQGPKGLSIRTSIQTSSSCFDSCSFTKVRFTLVLSHCDEKCLQNSVRNSQKSTVFLNQSIAAIFLVSSSNVWLRGGLSGGNHVHSVHRTNARFRFLKYSCGCKHISCSWREMSQWMNNPFEKQCWAFTKPLIT